MVGDMRRNAIIARLKGAEAELKARGVIHAALFGSVARGEDRPDSDIDVMVEIDPDAPLDVFAHAGIVHFIESLL